METIFYVLDKDYNRIGMVDTYVSLMWCKRYYEIGALDLEVEATEKNVQLFKQGNYIIRDDDDMICRIEVIEINSRDNNDNVMLIGAVDCKNILFQRVIAETINFNGTFDNYVKKIVTDNLISPDLTSRKISNFQYVSNTELSDKITQQVSYDNVGEKIISLCKSYLYGWKVYFEEGNFKMTLYKGKDLNLIFSPENDNLFSSKYSNDSTEYKNVALVGGEGEGNNRVLVWFGNQQGLDRHELFVEDSMSSNEIEDMEYLAKLKSKGGEEVVKKKERTEFEGEIDVSTYKYKEDFNLGDVVTIVNEYGISTQARFTEIIETWDSDGYTVEPKLEYLEFQPISPDVELTQELIYSADLTEDIADKTLTYTTEEHPYGITVEIFGAKGADGEDGLKNGIYIDGGGDIDGVTAPAPKGGVGGAGFGLWLRVDGKQYSAVAYGGAGGGGGGAGCGSTDPNIPVLIIPGKGGKGANADVITINIVFSYEVMVTPRLNYGKGANGSKGEGGKSFVYYKASQTVNTSCKGGDAFDGKRGENGSYNQSGNGADASPPNKSYCRLPTHIISNTSDLEVPHIKVYTWKNVG